MREHGYRCGLQYTLARFRAWRLVVAMAMVVALLSFGPGTPAGAHSVGQGNTEVFIDPGSSPALIDRALAGGGGLQAGDVIDYVIQFEPFENGATIGPGGYVAFYPPSFTTVVGASFLEPAGQGFVEVPAPDPGPFWDGVGPIGAQAPFGAPYDDSAAWPDGSVLQLYGDTGIFYSTDPAAAKYVGDGVDPDITPLGNNGYAINPTSCSKLKPPEYPTCLTHNLWDKIQVDAMGTAGGSINSSGRGNTPYLVGSPVAGPDTYYKFDAETNVGPFQRIAYPGSTIGIGPAPDPGQTGPEVTTAGIAWDATAAGVTVSEANPLVGATQVRFAVGGLYVGDVNHVRVRLRIDSLPSVCAPIDAEVFGGDAASPDGGKDNQWRYYIPVPANGDVCLVVDKVGPEAVLVGSPVTYTVRYANIGTSTLTGVTLSDVLDPGTSFVSASGGGALNGNSVDWTIGSLAPGEAGELTVTVDVTAPTGSTVSNTAIIASDTTKPSSDGASTIVVDSAADLAVTKTVNGDDTPLEGDTVTYDLSVTNNGPDPTTAVTVSDQLPPGLTFSSAAGDGTYASGTGQWDVASLAIDETATIQILATVDAGTKGQTITNVAENPQSALPDSDSSNNTASADVTVGPFSDLAVTNTVDDATPQEGGSVTFTIEVTNNGGDPADNVAVADLIPAGLTITNSTPAPGTTYDPVSGVWSIGALAPLDITTLTVTATVDAGTNGTLIENTATVTSDSVDPIPENDSARAGIFIGNAADLEVLTTVNTATPERGDPVTYTITVNNLGDDPANAVAVQDLLPPGVTFTSATASPGTTYDETTGLWSIGPLGATGTVTLTVDAVVDVDAGGVITNTATVSSTTPDPNPANDEAAVDISVLLADVTVAKTVDKPNQANGKPVVFTLTVTNNGPDAADGVVVDDLLNATDFTVTGSSPSQGVYSEATGQWDVGNLANGASATLTIDATVEASNGGIATNTATVTSTTADSDPDNNTGIAVISVKGKASDMVLTKSVNKPSAGELETVVFTIVAQNLGPDDEKNLEITDSLPAGLTFVSASATRGSFSDPVWTLGTLKKGQTGELTITAIVDAGTAGSTMENTATITNRENVDPYPLNDEGSASVTVPTADLSVAKTDAQDPVGAGGDVVYTITATNNGPDTAPAAQLVDTLPAGVSFVSAAPVQGTCSHATGIVTCDLGDLAVGSVAVTITVASGPTTGVIINQADVSSPAADSNPLNNTTTEDTTISEPPALIGDLVFEDLNANGVQDAGEPGVEGVLVEALVGATVEATTLSAADGSYQFSVAAGTYEIRFTAPAGATLSPQDVGFDNLDSDPDPATGMTAPITVGAGDTVTTIDAGVFVPATISGVVFTDADGSGTNGAEPGVEGYTVELLDENDVVVDSALTGIDGSYTFSTDPGTYSVRFVSPAGTKLTAQDIGADDTVDSDPDPLTGETPQFTVQSSEIVTDVDAGVFEPAEIGGTVGFDLDNSASLEGAEPGMAGVLVTLTGAGPDGVAGTADDTTTTVTTGADGTYAFTDLTPGDHELVVDESSAAAGTSLSTANSPSGTITLAPADSQTTDFGFVGTGSIGDLLWLDANADGTADPSEPGLPSESVTATWTGPDAIAGTADDVDFSASTDANGAYLITALPAGDYTVTASPAGLTATTTDPVPVSLGAAEAFGDADIGFAGTGSIGDFVWLDLDNDQLQDAGEPGLGGVEVTVRWQGPAGDVDFVTTTAADGSYLVTDLPDGTYEVTIDLATAPAGTTLSTPSPLTTTLSGGNDLSMDFGLTGSATVGDTVFLDTNGNGNQGGNEAGVAGVDITVVWAGVDGISGTADDVTITVVTDNNGEYLVENLPAGEVVVSLAGSALVSTTPTSVTLDLTPGATDLTADFGLEGTGTIGDTIIFDLNGNGTADPGEPGLPGVVVQLTYAGSDDTLGTADDSVETATTDAAGTYLFSALPTADNAASGLYEITVDNSTVPAGMTITADPEGDGTDGSALVTLTTVGEIVDTIDFAYTGTGSIGDLVFFDTNGDGVADPGEPGVEAVTVTAVWDGTDGTAGTADDVAYIATTDTNGNYLISSLPAGSYAITSDATTVVAGTELSLDPGILALLPAQDLDTADIGVRGTGSIGDTVWFDVNGDGIEDPGEIGLAGIDVTVTWFGTDPGPADDIQYPVATTDANGAYLVSSLPAGDYSVVVDSADAAPLAATTPETLTPTLGAAEALDTADFGFQGTSSIGDTVWFDVNDDGIEDPGEPAIPDVTVTATWAGPDNVLGNGDDFDFSVITDANGTYSLAGLPGGEYEIVVVPPAGYTAPPVSGITLLDATDRTDVDVPLLGNGSIGDRTFLDLNGDGIEDASDPALIGIDVDLTWAGPDGSFGTSDDVIFPTATTDASGDYLFEQLPPGDFRVDVDEADAPAGSALSTGNDGAILALTADQIYLEADFGFAGSGAIGDTVFLDIDGSGSEDAGDVGLAGITVEATWAGTDPGPGDDVVFTAVTDADGIYGMTGLPDGDYSVTYIAASAPTGTLPSTPASVSTTITGGSWDDTADFGLVGTGSIGDFVWLDFSADTFQDPTEPGLNDIEVTATWAGVDGSLGTADDVAYPSETTAAGGTYLVTKLPAGDFEVTVSEPAGYTATTPNPTTVTLASGAAVVVADFGFTGSGSLGDTVFYDIDSDGIQDVGEPGLADVDVTITWAGQDGTLGTLDDIVLPVITTAGDGTYGATNLPPGAYSVVLNLGDVGFGLLPGADSDGGQDGQSIVPLGDGQALDTVDFAFLGQNVIGDTVFFDTDSSGSQDAGEPGVANIDVDLTWAGPDGSFGTSDDVAYPTETTDNGGNYIFVDLPDGDYLVDLAGNAYVTSVLADGFTPNDPQPVTVAPANPTILTADFGLIGTGSIGDTIYLDFDNNGTQESGEPGLAGIEVVWLWEGIDPDPSDDVTLTAITDTDGFYQFTGMPTLANWANGDHIISVNPATVPAGLTQTEDRDGTLDDTTTVTLTSEGEKILDADFGYTGVDAGLPGTIGDTVFLDLNGDGIHDADEPALAAVEVSLTWAGPDGLLGTADDISYPTATTGITGFYEFTNLPAGPFVVEVVPPVGTTATNGSITITLDPGGTDLTADLGVRGTASIGDTVWFDTDTDSAEDAGEPGIPSVVVTLVGAGPDELVGTADDIIFDDMITDIDGQYLFEGLPAGEYLVSVDETTLPGETERTTSLNPYPVILGNGQAFANADFGYEGELFLNAAVYYDIANDAVLDPTDPPFIGIPITATWAGVDLLDPTDDVVFTAVTNLLGEVTIPNTPAGNYVIEVDETALPAGMTLTTGNQPFSGIHDSGSELAPEFGYIGTGSIGDTVFLDINADGTQDASDPLLDAVEVTVTWLGQDGVPSTDDVAFVTTSTGGTYGVSGLPAGEYVVDVTDADGPAGTTATTTDPLTFTLGANEDYVDADFGFGGSGEMGDLVWLDVNDDGVQDPGEPGLGGVGIVATWTGPSGPVDFPTITAPDGSWSVSNLPAGDFVVDINETTAPAGTAAGIAEPVAITLTVGESNLDVDVPFVGDHSLGGVVFLDLDADPDGIQDPEDLGVPGVLVTITAAGADGLSGTADDIVVTTTTDASGAFVVTGLPDGDYDVTVTPPTDLTPITTATQAFTINGAPVTVADFALAGSGSIGDTVWFDLNSDTTVDPGEPGMPGVAVSVSWPGYDLASAADDVTYVVNTATDGTYLVANLPAGTFTVSVDAATVAVGTVLTTANNPHTVVLTGGQAHTDADFGFAGTGSIGELVYYDIDANGTQDAGEPGLANVEIDVTWTGPDAVSTTDDVTTTLVTDGNGLFSATGLPAGAYTVTPVASTLPPGLAQTEGTPVVNVALGDGESFLDAIFGYTGTGSLGDTIWLDLDGDAVQQAAEPGLPGVTAEVIWAGQDGDISTTGDNLVISTVTTDALGNYAAINLPAGDYSVVPTAASLPAGVSATTTDPFVLSLAAAEVRDDADLGYQGSVSFGNLIWLDLDEDGTQGPNEPGIGGVELTVTWIGPAGDLTFPVTTSADGSWSVTGLPAGDYTVTLDGTTLPDGVSVTTDPDSDGDLVTSVSAIAGDSVGVDFGFTGTGSLAGRTWQDLDFNNAIGSSETMVASVPIEVVWTGADAAFGTADDVIFDRITAIDGTFTVTGLPEGSYRITAAPTGPAGLVLLTTPPQTVALSAGASITNIDFPYGLEPVPVDDVATTPEDTPINIAIRANDLTVGLTNYVIDSTTTPTHGSIVVNPDQTVTYSPSPDYHGPDGFTYRICTSLVSSSGSLPRMAARIDGVPSCGSAQVSVTVESVDDVPVAQDDVLPDGVVSGTVLDNDTGLGDGGITLRLVAAPKVGTLDFAPDGQFKYTAPKNYTGTVTFQYEVCDADGDCDTGTVTMLVSGAQDVPDLAFTGTSVLYLLTLGLGSVAVGSLLLGLWGPRKRRAWFSR